jgi:hypothetical protein
MTDIDDGPHEQGALTEALPSPALLPRGALGAWWWQGLRSACLLRPQWGGLQATPVVMAVLVIVGMALNVGVERLTIDGPANFYWASLLIGNWFGVAASLWACWLVRRPPQEVSPSDTEQGPPGVAALFAMVVAQGFVFTFLVGLLMLPMYRDPAMATSAHGRWLLWGVWAILLGWYAVALIRVLWVGGVSRWVPRLSAAVVIVGSLVLQAVLQPPRHWYPAYPRSSDAEADTAPTLKLTQELLEAQPPLLAAKLQALRADRPVGGSRHGTKLSRRSVAPRLFAITFAPYADEDVFARESNVVAGVMQERFHTGGRTIQLVNNRGTLGQWPWATPLNLQRTIQRMAQVMDRDDDVLFIHLTSHGARSGKLSAEFEPLVIDSVTPQTLKRWLDEAGVRWRVISISACYSGSWVQPLANADTLVMTAADADHTSYGCGSRSTLTFFGRAMYEEQLRQTWSFEQAHAAARKVIEQREREAGKTDGYSNPQIRVGEAVRAKLATLEASLRNGQGH